MKILTKAIEAKLIKNRNINNQTNVQLDGDADEIDFKPVVKLFGGGACTWLLTELDPGSNMAFGLCDLGLGTPELGYVSMDELMALRFQPFGLPIERDLHFKADKTLTEYLPELKGRIENAEKITLKMMIQHRSGIPNFTDNPAYWENEQQKVDNLNTLVHRQRTELGWDLLINESRRIMRGADSLCVIGIENWGAKGRFPKYGDMSKAMKGTEGESVKLLLSHDPSHWKEEIVKKYQDIDVMFSGHTHGMQFGIEVGSVKWSPVKYFYPEWADLYKDGEQQLYVNRGFGYIGYPGRFGILPEISVFTLTKA